MFSRKLTRSIVAGAAAIAVAGGSYGIVSATSSGGSAGQKVTVDEASSATYQKGASSVSASAITAGEPVLVLGTTSGTAITATQVIVQPAGGGSATSSAAKVIPFKRGAPAASKQAGQVRRTTARDRGRSGIQVISKIASEVEHLTVFQHQPHWVSPNKLGDGNVGESEQWLRRHLPYYLHWSRFVPFFTACEVAYEMNLVGEAWMKEHPTSTSSLNEDLRQISLEYIHECFGEDSELARKLTPQFPYGGKRPVRDPGDFEMGGYYWALAEPHVDFVTSPICRVVPEGVVTADGRLIELDAIIWATGMTFDWLSTIQVIGRSGVRLSRVWANNNARSYLGGTVPGFPNLFINDGPNTGVATGGGGHNFMTGRAGRCGCPGSGWRWRPSWRAA
jgi:hypothetical protein